MMNILFTQSQSLKWNPSATHSQATRGPLTKVIFHRSMFLKILFYFLASLSMVGRLLAGPSTAVTRLSSQSLLPDF